MDNIGSYLFADVAQAVNQCRISVNGASPRRPKVGVPRDRPNRGGRENMHVVAALDLRAGVRSHQARYAAVENFAHVQDTHQVAHPFAAKIVATPNR